MATEIMNWDKCKQESIREIEIDYEKVKSLLKMSEVRAGYLKKQEYDEKTCSIISEGYYEMIKELLVALLLKNGLKSNNHECLISFFKTKYPQYEYEALIIHQLKDIRNRISYDGMFVKKDYLDKNKLEFEHIIEILKELIKKD